MIRMKGLVLSTLVCLLVDVEKISAADVLYSLGSETSPLKIDNTTFMGKENTTILEINFAGLKIIGPNAFTKLSNLMKLDLDYQPVGICALPRILGTGKTRRTKLTGLSIPGFQAVNKTYETFAKA
ncbi:Uncharacterised protein g442 [Pycnogonum litorale]